MNAWDCIGLAGFALIVGGLAVMYWPLAIVVAGSMMLAATILNTTRKRAKQ